MALSPSLGETKVQFLFSLTGQAIFEEESCLDLNVQSVLF